MSAIANLVIFQFIASEWVPLMPAQTPSWLKEPEAIADLVAGSIVESDGEFFRAHRLADSPLVLSNPPVRTRHALELPH